MTFDEILQEDMQNSILSLDEFAGIHNLNGQKCTAVVQNIISNEKFTVSGDFVEMYADNIMVNVSEKEINAVPFRGQRFSVDGKDYEVLSCQNVRGILTIRLGSNET